jgi:predicted Fe-S protein YdhL (DUF1289 family)
MAVCAEYKIPHSTFLSWSADDRAKAMWWQLRQRQVCAGCGTRRDEWVTPDGPRLDAYTAEPQVCHGCRAISAERDRIGENAPAGIQIVLKKPKPKEVARGEQT